jgi:N-acetylmuramoyl-L-alanine amidase
MLLRQAGLTIGLLALAACTTPPVIQHTPLPANVRPSPNFDQRRANYVILHYTSDDTAEHALRTLTDPVSKVSAHYLIARDGRIYALVDERSRAWHAGVSYWGGNRDVNSSAIGIELDNNGREPFSAPLVDALLLLLGDLKERFSIPTANFIGHSDVAPRRKVDPGRAFPWQRMALAGFGLWCDPPYGAPPQADGITLLDAFGYDVVNPPAAISAFKLHFAPDGDLQQLTDDDRALLACLLDKKRQGD